MKICRRRGLTGVYPCEKKMVFSYFTIKLCACAYVRGSFTLGLFTRDSARVCALTLFLLLFDSLGLLVPESEGFAVGCLEGRVVFLADENLDAVELLHPERLFIDHASLARCGLLQCHGLGFLGRGWRFARVLMSIADSLIWRKRSGWLFWI